VLVEQSRPTAHTTSASYPLKVRRRHDDGRPVVLRSRRWFAVQRRSEASATCDRSAGSDRVSKGTALVASHVTPACHVGSTRSDWIHRYDLLRAR